MCAADFVLYEEEFRHLEEALRRLRQEANGKAVFLIDKNGQQIASTGEIEQFDVTSLASLTAGNVAATLPAVSEARDVVSNCSISPAAAICWPFLSIRKTALPLAS